MVRIYTLPLTTPLKGRLTMSKTRKRTTAAKDKDSQMKSICDQLIENNETISARKVSRLLEIQTTSLTRDPLRLEILNDAKNKQEKLREWLKRQPKQSRKKDAESLAARDLKIENLEEQKQFLIASHKAMIMAVGEIGGMAAWKRFFDGYQEVLDGLESMGAMPEAEVITLEDKQRK